MNRGKEKFNEMIELLIYLMKKAYPSGAPYMTSLLIG